MALVVLFLVGGKARWRVMGGVVLGVRGRKLGWFEDDSVGLEVVGLER